MPDKAIEYAKAFIREHVAHPECIIEEEAGDWLYCARYSLESDYVFVERGILDGAANDKSRCWHCGKELPANVHLCDECSKTEGL